MCLIVALMGICTGDLFGEDGILVEQRDSVRTISGLWTVVVVIHPPGTPNFTDWVDALSDFLQANKTSAIPANDREYWLARLNNFRSLNDAELEPDDSGPAPSRRKRGLANFIGRISQGLFGTAMDSDINALQDAVDDTRERMVMLYHNQESMISVLNQTKRYLMENRLDIEHIEEEMGNLAAVLNSNVVTINNIIKRMNVLDVQRKVDTNIQQLETVYNDYLTQKHLYHRQKMQLEREWLTEDVFPPAHLEAVLMEIRTLHFGTLPLEWYYQNVRVNPIWSNPRELAFRAILPMLSSGDYLYYHLRYFPVPLGDGHLRKVLGRSDVVINTVSGTMFEPQDHHCIGKGPMVCRPTHEILQDSCEAALVSGRLGAECTIELAERGDQTVVVYREGLADSEVVIVSYENASVTIRCVGRVARHKFILGPVRLPLPDGCSIETSAWRVSGIIRGSSRANFHFKTYVTLPAISITWPSELHTEFAKQLSFIKRANINLMDVPGLQNVNVAKWKWDHSHIGFVIVGAVVVIGLVVGIGTGVYCLRRRRTVRRPGVSHAAPPAPSSRDDVNDDAGEEPMDCDGEDSSLMMSTAPSANPPPPATSPHWTPAKSSVRPVINFTGLSTSSGNAPPATFQNPYAEARRMLNA